MDLAPGRRYGISPLDDGALTHIGPVVCLEVSDGRGRLRVEQRGEVIEVEERDLVRVDRTG